MWISGSPGSCSTVSPPQPNHSPPVRFSALRMPIASPPGAADLRGSEIRFETQTSRVIQRFPPAAKAMPSGVTVTWWAEFRRKGLRGSDRLAVAAHPDRSRDQAGGDDETDPQPGVREEADGIQRAERAWNRKVAVDLSFAAQN